MQVAIDGYDYIYVENNHYIPFWKQDAKSIQLNDATMVDISTIDEQLTKNNWFTSKNNWFALVGEYILLGGRYSQFLPGL